MIYSSRRLKRITYWNFYLGKKGKGRKNKFGKQGKNGDADGDKKRQDEKMEDVAEPTASGQASESTLKRKNDDETREEHTKKSKPDEE